MKNYDVVIIGGGLSGLSAGIYLQELGCATAIVSKGSPGLVFSTGNLDLYRSLRPFSAIEKLKSDAEKNVKTDKYSNHPYSVMTSNQIRKAMQYLVGKLNDAGLIMENKNEENCLTITPYGLLKESYFVQQSMYLEKIPLWSELYSEWSISQAKGVANGGFVSKKTHSFRAAVISFDNYLDFPTNMVVSGLSCMFPNADIKLHNFKLNLDQRYFYRRSTDISRHLAQNQHRDHFLHHLEKLRLNHDLILIPALLPKDENYIEIMQKLTSIEDPFPLLEIPTSPPSVSGERLLYFLKKIYMQHGGITYENMTINQARFFDSKVSTKKIAAIANIEKNKQFVAKQYILASGSFFSGGLHSELNRVWEPVFGLDVLAPEKTGNWSGAVFKDFAAHHILSAGIDYSPHFQALKGNQLIENLYCCGSVLSGYNPLAEGCAGGVAISSAISVAQKIAGKNMSVD